MAEKKKADKPGQQPAKEPASVHSSERSKLRPVSERSGH